LLEHFRNLLVCKDAATVSLLQVSESAERKYIDQSRNADMSFLLSALSVASQCDINYKAAKNQRLHVELCLMKLANLPNILQLHSLAAVDETAKKKVEPEQSIADKEIKEPAPPYENKPEEVPLRAGNAPAVNAVAGIPQPVAQVTARPSKLRSTTQLVPAVPVAQNGAVKEVAAPSPGEVKPAVPEKPATLELTPENLQQVWHEFAENRKRTKDSTTEEIALNRAVELVDFTIQIALDNDPQMDAMQGMRYDLLGYLKSRFNAPRLEINPRVAPHEVQRLPYTPAEKFNYMAEKNPYLLQLKQALGLDVDF
jgi:DNA polymerase-3 subunit gamma/tau